MVDFFGVCSFDKVLGLVVVFLLYYRSAVFSYNSTCSSCEVSGCRFGSSSYQYIIPTYSIV